MFLVTARVSGRDVLRDVVRLRSLCLLGQPWRRVMEVAGRGTGRAVMDVSECASVRRRAGMRVRNRMRGRVHRAMGFMTERKTRRMGLEMPRRLAWGGWSLGGRVQHGRRRRRGRPARTRGGVRSLLRRQPAVDRRGVMRDGCNRSRRSGGGGHRRRTGRSGGGRVRTTLRRGRRRPMVCLRAVRRSGHDHLVQRRRSEARARADRREVHRACVEEQRHRGRAEQERSRRHRHSLGGGCEPSRAFPGRHRPLLPFPDGSPPAVAQRYKKPGRTATPRMGPTFAVSGNH